MSKYRAQVPMDKAQKARIETEATSLGLTIPQYLLMSGMNMARRHAETRPEFEQAMRSSAQHHHDIQGPRD